MPTLYEMIHHPSESYCVPIRDVKSGNSFIYYIYNGQFSKNTAVVRVINGSSSVPHPNDGVSDINDFIVDYNIIDLGPGVFIVPWTSETKKEPKGVAILYDLVIGQKLTLTEEKFKTMSFEGTDGQSEVSFSLFSRRAVLEDGRESGHPWYCGFDTQPCYMYPTKPGECEHIRYLLLGV
jgi:hypothetical protein